MKPSSGRAAERLREGMSSLSACPKGRARGLISTLPRMSLNPQPDGTYLAKRREVLHRNSQRWLPWFHFGQDSGGTGEYVFFQRRLPSRPSYHLLQNVTASQNYVAQYALRDYPGHGSRTPVQGGGGLGYGAQYSQVWASSTWVGLDRHLHPCAL